MIQRQSTERSHTSEWKYRIVTAGLMVLSMAFAWSGRAAETSRAEVQKPKQSEAAKGVSVVSEEPVQEVDVSGERSGPQLWRVSKGDHVLWLLGTLDPLPKRMTWRSHEVQDVLIHSQAVLASQPAVSAHAGLFTWVGVIFDWRRVQRIPPPESLKDWVEPGLYERFEALKARYDARDSSIERLKPIFAATSLDRRVLDTVGLVSRNEVEDAVLTVIRHSQLTSDRRPTQTTQ